MKDFYKVVDWIAALAFIGVALYFAYAMGLI